MKRNALGLIAVAAIVAVSPVHAACEFRAITNVAFGTYNVFSGTDDDNNGSVRIRCNPSDTYTLKFSTGTSGSFSPRQLASGVNRLNYNLYMDAARTQIWGDGSSGTSFVTNTHSGAVTYTIYGRVPSGQDPNTGTYSDTITMTLEY
jgi:spore coat protein U-like protein